MNFVGGLATQAVRYPPRLVAGVLKAIGDELRENGGLNAVHAFPSRPNPNQGNWAEWSDEAWDDVAKFFECFGSAASDNC